MAIITFMGLALSCLCFLFGCLSFSAQALSLWTWQSTTGGPSLLLAKRDHQNPSQSLQEYLRLMNHGKSAVGLVGRTQIEIKDNTLKELHINPSRPLLFINANEFDHLKTNPNYQEASTLNKFMKKQGLEVVWIPPLAAEALSEEERAEFLNLLTHFGQGVLSIGGDDIHPALYGEKNTYSKKTHLNRDESEAEIILQFRRSKKMVYGICRGHQLINAALGGKLFQDLPSEHPAGVDHSDVWHKVTLKNKSWMDSLLKNKPMTNSYHHQSVQTPGRGLVVSAWTDETNSIVVEATESTDGRVRSTQFHPETMNNAQGRSILLSMANKIRSSACEDRLRH